MGSDNAVLITGASGQVGLAMKALRTDAVFASRSDLDVTDERMVADACRGKRIVVHLAAMTDVDRCELEPEVAMSVNAVGTQNVARAATHAGARVIFLSTDYVFDGTKEGEYREDDQPAPLNVYGSSKQAGESAVLQDSENVVVRSSTVFGEGRNFVKTMLQLGQKMTELRVVDDQISRPTAATDLAQALWDLADDGRPRGIVHVAGDGIPCSRAELARATLEAAGLRAKVMGVDTESFLAASERPQAPRPLNSVLALEQARTLGVSLAPWVPSLQRYVRQMG